MTGLDRSDDNQLLVALRHPLRRSILRLMSDDEPISPRELSNQLELPLSNVSYHVRVLAECDAVTLVRTAPARGSMQHFYCSTLESSWAREVLGLGDVDGGESRSEPGP